MAEVLINSKNYYNNLDWIASHIGSKEKIALVLKDNAYGHGLSEIAKLAKNYGIKSVFVKNEREAMEIKDLFPHITMFYGRFLYEKLDYLPSNIHPTIHSKKHLANIPPKTAIELKVNIGMNRNGIEPEELESVIDAILHQKLELFGVFTHDGYSDENTMDFHNLQKLFCHIKEEVKQIAKKKGFLPPRFHSLNSAGALRDQNVEEIARIGIAAYGYAPLNFPLAITQKLKPVLSLWADRICTHHLKKGDRIGYGGVSQLDQDSIVSTYDIGYGDGFFRLDGSKEEYFSAEGFKILPRTSMDCFSALSNQDKICVFNDATALAKIFHTIPYEILTSISPFIKRRVI